MQMEEWDAFDVNRVTQLTQGRPLEAVALEVLHRFNLLEKLRLPKQKLRSFLRVSPPRPFSGLAAMLHRQTKLEPRQLF